jgi:hypothetical protein
VQDIFAQADEERRATPHPWAVHDAASGALVGFVMISDNIQQPVDGGSSPACRSRYAVTQLPNVVSLMFSSRATSAIGRDVSITSLTASSLNSGENFLRW